MHHAIIDGESGTELLKALHSITPEPIDFGDEADQQRFHADREPTAIELYSRALVHNVERMPGLARFSLGHGASARRASAPVPSTSWRARACSRWRGCAASRPATSGRC